MPYPTNQPDDGGRHRRAVRTAPAGACRPTTTRHRAVVDGNDGGPQARGASAGFTLLEVLLVVTVLGVLLAVGAVNLRTPSVRVAADAVQSFVQQTRFEAIQRNRPVIVTLAGDGRSLQAHLSTQATAIDCGATGTLARKLDLSDYRAVAADATDLPLVWLPSGEARTCSASVLASAGLTISLSDGSKAAEVHVSSGGQVAVR